MPTTFFRAFLLLIGFAAFFFLLWEPHLEGRNRDSTVFDVYFRDPFLIFAYMGSIPFFISLYFGYKVLGYMGKNSIFTQTEFNDLRAIRYCGYALTGFVLVGEIMISMSESDDRAGGVFLGALIGLGSATMVAFATMLERIWRKANAHKTEATIPD